MNEIESLGIDYFITGSVASAFFGESRYTHDIDAVVLLRSCDVDRFCEAFSLPEFYVDPKAVWHAIETDGMFNVIHVLSSEKIDVILPADSDFNASRFSRKRRVEIHPGCTACVACPEHLILSKMMFFNQGGSEKHLRDITSILLVQGKDVDRPYIEMMADRMGTRDVWDAIVKKLRDAGYA